MSGVLGDVRVIDLSGGYGAYASRLFAELGADVVRLELEGHDGRERRPLTPDGTGLHHFVRNSGKSVMSFEDADGLVAAFSSIVTGADIIFVSDDTPSELGDPRSFVDGSPGIVVVSITPYGVNGSCSDRQITELIAQSMAGIVHRSGDPSLPPVSAPGSMCEDVGAVNAAFAALLALHSRSGGGAGQFIDVSTILSLAQCTDMGIPLWSLMKSDQSRQGGGMYPLFECSDGLARIVLPMAPKEWRSLIAWLGSPPEWTGPAWDAPMLGPDERAQILDRLPARFAAGTRAELEIEGAAAGVRITSVLTPSEVIANEHTVGRGTFADVDVMEGRSGRSFVGLFGVDGHRVGTGEGPITVEDLPVWSPRPTDGFDASARLPLSGLRVIEIGTGVAAPEATKLLAEWGAEVIKVEHRARPDFQRMVMGGEMNPAYATVGRSKRIFGADLATEEGAELVLRLIEDADALIENNATGVLDRLGLGWESISERNPGIVLIDTQLYGDRGPWANRKGYGPSARAVGGLTWLWAHGPDAPRGVQSIHPDHLGGRLCAFAALAGVHASGRDGEGVRIDIAQFEAVAGLLADLLLAESLDPGSVVPTGNIDPDHAPWGLYRCADDDNGSQSWLAVCIRDDDEWSRLRDHMAGSSVGSSQWPDDWSVESQRVADRDAVDRAVGEWTALLDAQQVEDDLQSLGLAAGRVLHPRTQASHPLFVDRGFVVELDQPGMGPLLVEGPAFEGSTLPAPLCGSAPLLGEHTEEICRDLLGLDPAAIASLQGIGAIDGPGE